MTAAIEQKVSPPQEEKAFCRTCRRHTRHSVVSDVSRQEFDDECGVTFGVVYRILECRGCDTGHFQQITWDDSRYGNDGEPIDHVVSYPDGTASRDPVNFAHLLPPIVDRAYREVLAVFPVAAPVLTAIGLRALAEAICIERSCKKDNLKSSLQELVQKGFFSQKEAQFLDEHRVMGNEAAHELTPPSKYELDAALSIVESLMRTLYELPELAADIRGHRERRRRKAATPAPSSEPPTDANSSGSAP